MPDPIDLPGVYTNGSTADGVEVQTDFNNIETFLNTTGVHVYQAGTVAEAALAASAVTAAKLAADSVTTVKILDGSVTAAKLAVDSVQSAGIANEAITTAKLADGAVTADKLSAGIISGSAIPDGGVAPRHMAKAVGVEIISNINVNTPGATFGGATPVTGEVILLAAQTSTPHQNGPWIFDTSSTALVRPEWFDSSLDSFEGSVIPVTRGTYAGLWRQTTSGAITVGTTTTVWKMLDYFGSGATGSQPPAGKIAAGGMYFDTTLNTLQRSDGTAWTTPALASANILDGTIVNADVNASAAVAYSKLNLSNSIVAGDITSSAVTAAKIQDGAVTAAKLDPAAVGTAAVADSSITSAKIADGTIVLADLAASLQQFLVPTGAMIDFGLTSAQVPTGWLACDGSAVTVASGNTTLRDALIAAGNPYGVSGPDPKLPDSRGKVTAGKAVSGTFGTLGGVPGVEQAAILLTELPAHTHAVSTSVGYTPSGSVSSIPTNQANHANVWTYGGAGGSGFTSGSYNMSISSVGHSGITVSSSFTGTYVVLSPTGSATTITGQGSAQLSRVQPTIVVNKIMKT